MHLGRSSAFVSLLLSAFVVGACGDSTPPPSDGSTCALTCGGNARCNAMDVCECLPFTTGTPSTGCVPDCSGFTCTNGTCSVNTEGAFCDCSFGWDGAACDVPVNACLTGTRCMNGGTCISTGPNSFSCDCEDGFVGATCQTTATGCAARPCDNGSCAMNAGVAECKCERGYSGAACDTSANSCGVDQNTLHGPACGAELGVCNDPEDGPGYDCACVLSSGTRCELPLTATTPVYVDVVYNVTATFRVANTPLGAGDVTKTVGTNAAEPQFAHPDAAASPFPTTSFSHGFIRVRYPANAAGAPTTGPAQIIEWYVPIEFEVSGSVIPTVRTNVDHSAGLVALTNRYVDFDQTLHRRCEAVANGTVATSTGTTLTWGTCAVQPTGTPTFGTAASQADVTMDDGCLRRTSSSGNARCVAGGCGLVPNITVGDQRGAWDQKLNPFVYATGDLATSGFTMAEVQVPNDTGTTTWLAITSATPIFSEPSDTPTCDELCDADSCEAPPPPP